MNIKDLRAKTGLSQRKFGERLGLQGQSILLYEKEERKIPESIKKLIRYEFAEYLPDEERLATAGNGKTTVDDEGVSQLKQENEALKQRLEQQEGYITLQKRNIELLEDQISMYKNMLPGNDRSKTA